MLMTIFKKTPTTTLPDSVETHDAWVKHQKRVAELSASLTLAEDTLARLVSERDRLQAVQHEHAVRVVLGELPADDTSAVATQLAEIDGQIVLATVRVSTVREAVRRLEALGTTVRGSIEAELREQIQREGKVVITRMAAALLDVVACNQELRRLEAFGELAVLPVSSWQEFGPEEWRRVSLWLAQARAAAVNV